MASGWATVYSNISSKLFIMVQIRFGALNESKSGISLEQIN